MKKLVKVLMLWLTLFFWASISFGQDSLLNETATWDNVTMNFSDSNSTTAVIIDSFTGNVCGTDYSGFLLTWYTNREWNWYVYFGEYDGDDTVNSCVAVILSGTNFYLTGEWVTDSWTWYKMHFNNIKLIYNSSDKVYYFSWDATDDALWAVPNWQNVYVSWLNLIDWSKTLVYYSNLTGWSYVANGTSGYVGLILKDVWGNAVNILNTITVKITYTTGSISGYTYLDESKDTEQTFSVSNGIVNIPVYILKAVNNWEIKLKFSYDIADMDGNTEHTLTFSNIKVKEPLSNVDFSLDGPSIVGEEFTWNFYPSYVVTGQINFISLTWSVDSDSAYNLDLLSSSDTWFTAKIYPKDSNKTISKISSKYTVNSYKVWFSNFSDTKVSYPYSKILNFVSYADKRVNYNNSFTWFVLNQQFTWWDTVNTLSFKPILRDKNWYVIPDLKFDIKIKDAGIADSYSWWDCNEIDSSYQTNCNALQIKFNWTTYSWNIDGVLWNKFNYNNINSNYSGINVMSYKPVSGWKLKFDITNLENISSDWDFTNSWNYLNLPANYNWYIENIIFKPFVNIRLKGLDDEVNYVDINNSIYLKMENISSNNLTLKAYNLSWEITQPNSWVEFETWWLLTWENISINSQSETSLEQTILFSLSYTFDGEIKFNYNHWSYSYSLVNWIWDLKLRPWNFYFNLWGIYKVGGTYVNGIVNKAQKYSETVKNTIWRKQQAISTRFASIYNKLRKKANYLTQWLDSKLNDRNDNDIKPDFDLKWWVKYYNCWDGGWEVVVESWSYVGSNTIILKNCKLVIKWNITKWEKFSNLIFFLFDDKKLDLLDSNYLDRVSNIYITENVSDVYAGLLTKWSIFTINDSNIDNIVIPNRNISINDKQLYIQGTLMWKNNVWGSFLIQWEEKFTIWWSKKIYKTDSLWGKSSILDLRNIAQVFDINFWRGFKYNWTNISNNWYANYCKSHTDSGCKYPVYIQFDPNIKNNILFK